VLEQCFGRSCNAKPLEIKRHERRENYLPIPGRKPLFADYVAAYFEKSKREAHSPARLQRMQGRVIARDRRRRVALQHPPQDAVVDLIVHPIGGAKVQPF